MKKALGVFGLFSSLVLLTGCPQDVDILPENNTSEGTWHLRNVSGGFAGIDLDFIPNEVKWTFTEADSTVEVLNNIINMNAQNFHSGPDDGTYSYSVQLINGSEHLLIDGEDKGIMLIENDSLFIDDGVGADGFMSLFVR